MFCFYVYRLSLLVTSLGADIHQGCFITMTNHSLLITIKCCFLFIQTWPISCHCIAIFGVRWFDIRPWYKRTWLCFWNANCTRDTLRWSNANRQNVIAWGSITWIFLGYGEVNWKKQRHPAPLWCYILNIVNTSYIQFQKSFKLWCCWY